MNLLHRLGFAVLLPALAAAQQGSLQGLEERRLHLGKPGQWEWQYYRNVPVDAERWEHRFQAHANAREAALLIRQQDVKLGWPVTLNGRRLGTLTTQETPLESVFALAPGWLRDGENVLAIEPPAGLDDIEIGPVRLSPAPVAETLAGATVEVVVTDEAGGGALPCRLTVTRPDGTLQPLQAEPATEVATRVGVVYTRAGRATLQLPPGDYRLQAGRGFEWSLAGRDLSLRSGAREQVALQLRREVPTAGWVAADSHIHTRTFSGHGDALVAERLLTIAGEGIELAIATDHNHHADFAPEARETGLDAHFTPVIGNEVTTKHGHFNAFPVAAGAAVVDAREPDWARLLPAIRATPGVQVVTLNHPRDVHSGFVPLGGVQFNPRTGKHRQEAALDIDALEVVTSAAMQSDVHLLFRDWFALLNRGHRIAAVGSSDSHDVDRFILGQGRTYVAMDDADPAALALDQAWRSYREGRLLVSLGLLAQIRVNGRYGVGDLAPAGGPTVQVEASVFGPSWVLADHVALYVNGQLWREQALQDPHCAGEKARVVWEIPRPEHDVHLVVIATGPGVRGAFWEIPRPYQPADRDWVPRVLGATNPVWLDADGDGAFESARACAERLVREHGNHLERLRTVLQRHDEAVRIQAAALLPAGALPP